MKGYPADIPTYPKGQKILQTTGIDTMWSYPRDNPRISLDEGYVYSKHPFRLRVGRGGPIESFAPLREGVRYPFRPRGDRGGPMRGVTKEGVAAE